MRIKKSKKAITILLSLMLTIQIFSIPVFADESVSLTETVPATSSESSEGTRSNSLVPETVTGPNPGTAAAYTAENYTVDYDANGGSGSVPSDSNGDPDSEVIETTEAAVELTETRQATLMLLGAAAPATDFQYTVSSDNTYVTITQYIGAGGAVEIPYKIADLPVKVIADNAFVNKTAVTSVTMPDSVVKIGDDVFIGCRALKSIVLSPNLTSLGQRAFFMCDVLESVNFNGAQLTEIKWYTFAGCTKLSSISLPETLTTIGNEAFYNNVLTSIDIPENVTTIGDSAFMNRYCVYLTRITFHGSNLKTIGDNAFDSAAVTSLDIPESVTTIGASAFNGCINLENVKFHGTNLKTIGADAFSNTHLNSITIPAGVTNIGDGAFGYCYYLTTAIFEGYAPTTFGGGVFFAAHQAVGGGTKDFRIYYYASKQIGTVNWTTPTWNSYPAYPLSLITYDANGGTGSIPSVLATSGDNVKLNDGSALSRTGATLKGWCLSPNDVVVRYSTGQTYTVGSTDLPLYAKWEDNTVNFIGGWLPQGTVNRPYNAQVSATGGSGRFTYSLYTGPYCFPLPPGLTLSTNGSISGTPTTVALYGSIRIIATDTVTGMFKDAYFNIETLSEPTVATPIADPAAGGVEKGTTVSLSCQTTGAAIYYTTDGSTPTTGSAVYVGPITINAATTISALAVKADYKNSDVLTAAYTVNTHTVTYSANGGTTNVPASRSYAKGETVTVSFASVPTRTGYTFAGWATSSTAATPQYTDANANKTFVMGTADVTLYAVWTGGNTEFVILGSPNHNLRLTTYTKDGTTYNLIRGLNPRSEKVNSVMSYFKVNNGYWTLKSYNYSSKTYTEVQATNTTTTVTNLFEIDVYRNSGALYNKYYIIIMGDLNCSGSLNNTDTSLLLNHVRNTFPITDPLIRYSADINGSNSLNVTDVSLLKNHVANIYPITQ